MASLPDAIPPDSGPAAAPPPAAEELDLRGEVCPYTFLKARLALETLDAGALLRVRLDSAASARDVPRSLTAAGHDVLGMEATGDGAFTLLVRRGAA